MNKTNFAPENPNNGFLPSRVSTAQRNAFDLPSMGLLIFNTTTNTLQVNIGNSYTPDWRDIATGTAPGIAQNITGGSPSKCFLLSRVATTTRNAFTNPAKGLMIYNLTTNTIQVNLGTETTPDWKDLISNSNVDNGSLAITTEQPNNGFALPRLTTTERNAITDPMVGSIFFNSTTRTFQANLGTAASPTWNNFTVSNAVYSPTIPAKTDVLGYYKAAHLLRRTCYKVTKAMINAYAVKTPQQALSDLFVFTPPSPSRPLNNLGETYYPTVTETTVTDSINTGDGSVTYFEKYWWLYNALNTPNMQYKIINLFHLFFITDDVVTSWRFFDYLELLRYQSNGNIKDLAIMMTRDSRMLYYLDNRLNNKNSPNQNYAREFLELFTILKGEQIAAGNYTNYTETDVQQAARVFTGFTTNNTTNGKTTRITNVDPVTQIPRGIINVANHDTGNKTFSSAFGNAVIIGGTTEATIQQELVNFVTMVFNQPETAKNYCRKIYRYFIGRTITPTIETNIITPLATIMMDNNYDIVPVIKELLRSQHFYDEDDTISGDQTIGALVKSPMDLMLQMFTNFEIAMPNYATNPSSIHSFMSSRVYSPSYNASLPIFQPLSVNGYTGYSDGPNYDKNWITTGALRIRYTSSIDALISGYTYNGFLYKLVTATFVRYSGNFSNPANADTLLQDFYDLLFVATPQGDRHTYFKNSLLNGLSLINWQNEWNNYISTNNAASVKIALDRLVKALVKSPEYQVM